MWDFRDSWILQAIVYAAGRTSADLSKVLASADYINVLIPTVAELERSVNRLVAGGLVSVEGTTFRSTRAARRIVRKGGGPRSGIRTLPPLIEKALNEAVPFPTQPSDWSLAEEEWHQAYDRYYPPEKRQGP